MFDQALILEKLGSVYCGPSQFRLVESLLNLIFPLICQDLLTSLNTFHISEKMLNFFIINPFFLGPELLLVKSSLGYVMGEITTVTILRIIGTTLIEISSIVVAHLVFGPSAHLDGGAGSLFGSHGLWSGVKLPGVGEPGSDANFATYWGGNDEE